MEKTLKHYGTIEEQALKLFVNGQELKNKKIELFRPLTHKELLEINNKEIKAIKLRQLKNYFLLTLDNLEKVIELYKELYNKTEYFEEKSIIDFNYKEWNCIRKAKNRLVRYYNEFINVFLKVKEDEKKCQKELENLRKS